MSKSAGLVVSSSEIVQVLPPEIVRYFILRFAPAKQLFFDQVGVTKLIDDYAAETDKQLLDICSSGLQPTVSKIPFSHLAASYQAALKDPDKTLEIIGRTEYQKIVASDAAIIKRELAFINQWLEKWAPQEAKFELLQKVDQSKFNDSEKDFLAALGQKIAKAPQDADGDWFHKAIYEIKEADKLTPEQVFKPLYRALIGKDSGPRAGWFLSILPRDWLVKRLRLED